MNNRLIFGIVVVVLLVAIGLAIWQLQSPQFSQFLGFPPPTESPLLNITELDLLQADIELLNQQREELLVQRQQLIEQLEVLRKQQREWQQQLQTSP